MSARWISPLRYPSGWILMDSEGPEGPREKQLALW